MQPKEGGQSYVTELPQTGSTRSGTCKRQRLPAPAGIPFLLQRLHLNHLSVNVTSLTKLLIDTGLGWLVWTFFCSLLQCQSS